MERVIELIPDLDDEDIDDSASAEEKIESFSSSESESIFMTKNPFNDDVFNSNSCKVINQLKIPEPGEEFFRLKPRLSSSHDFLP